MKLHQEDGTFPKQNTEFHSSRFLSNLGNYKELSNLMRGMRLGDGYSTLSSAIS